MAEGSQSGLDPVGVKVWTFIIRGGQVMDLRFQGRPAPGHQHNGRHSVWKFVGTADEARKVESLLKGPLVGAAVECHTEEETDEMLAIRRGDE